MACSAPPRSSRSLPAVFRHRPSNPPSDRSPRPPYLFLRHWAYPQIDLLLERGVLRGLSPVVRPYRRLDVARAVKQADTAAASATERGWLDQLRRELGQELRALATPGERAWVAADLAAEDTLRSQSHRDPLRPQGPARVEGAAELNARFAFPGVAGQTHLRSDKHFENDAQIHVLSNRLKERAEDAYVELQTPYLRVLLGRLYRNWAPPPRACRGRWCPTTLPWTAAELAARLEERDPFAAEILRTGRTLAGALEQERYGAVAVPRGGGGKACVFLMYCRNAFILAIIRTRILCGAGSPP